MTDLAALQAELEAAEAECAEEASLERRQASLRELSAELEERLTEALVKLGDEQGDVAALESFSPARIWAALRGTRVEDLDREQAEVRAAEYVVAELRARLQSLEGEAAALAGRLAALAGARERRERALAAKEEAVTAAGGRAGVELTRLAAQLGSAGAELTEVVEAFDAATAAGTTLHRAVAMLGKATDWADVDTFLGGGLLTDAIKYDRMDRANAQLRDAGAALARLDKELGDLGRSGLPGPRVDGLTRTFDVWFDNIFTDWSVKRRIVEADDRARRALHAVDEVRRSLMERRSALEESMSRMRARRVDLLRG